MSLFPVFIPMGGGRHGGGSSGDYDALRRAEQEADRLRDENRELERRMALTPEEREREDREREAKQREIDAAQARHDERMDEFYRRQKERWIAEAPIREAREAEAREETARELAEAEERKRVELAQTREMIIAAVVGALVVAIALTLAWVFA